MPGKDQSSGAVAASVLDIVIQGQAELRTDVKKLTESTNSLNEKFASYIERNTHTETRVDKLENNLDEVSDRVDLLEKSNIRVFAVAGVYASVAISIIGGSAWWYVNVYKPQQENSLTNKSAIEVIEAQTEAIEDQTRVNETILEYLRGGE